jgi:hypothetical protein
MLLELHLEIMAKPDEETIEFTIRDIVTELFRAGDFENLTVKRVRTQAEENLGLDAGWFKRHAEWKDRSASVIHEEAVRRNEEAVRPSEAN